MNGNSSVEEIKNRLDIIDVIGSYIKLQKAGANFRALCPFHSEKNPSFFVSPSRQIWHCFGGCGKGGDIFKFVMLIEGVEFGDALRLLGQKAGVVLKRESPELQTQRQRLYEICELATLFFEKQLEGSNTGKKAEEYLISRGFSQESIKKWRIGYNPEAWQGLSDFLVGKGYGRDEIVRAGLAVKKEENNIGVNPRNYPRESAFTTYDRFRGRIVFPVFDINSQVIGFGGRVFGEKDEVAKYVNTPNTLLYDKSRVLYGLDRAKQEIRKKQECILVEGYTDAILVSQAGFPNVVATSGTALTGLQLTLLKRYTENITIAFDMDFAGDSATKRSIDLAQEMGFNIKVLLLPAGSDPADVASKDAGLLNKLFGEARSILEFYFETTFGRLHSGTPQGKKEISRVLLPVIKRIPNSIERSFWVRELARRLEVREEDVLEELKKVVSQKETYPADNKTNLSLPQKSRRELIKERLLALALKFPECLNEIGAEGKALLTDLKSKAEISQEYFNYLSLRAELEQIGKKEVLPEIQFCIKEIRSLELKDRMNQISAEIKKAEERKDIQKAAQLSEEFNQLSKMIVQLT